MRQLPQGTEGRKSAKARAAATLFLPDLQRPIKQVAELRRVIEGDQRQLVQWAEEKLSLATIALDLVGQHRKAIDTDLGALQYELKVCPACSPCQRFLHIAPAEMSCRGLAHDNRGEACRDACTICALMRCWHASQHQGKQQRVSRQLIVS